MSDDALISLLKARMAATSNPLNVDNPRYWYPLATATYGVEEILQAIDSMTSYRTSMWNKTRTFEEKFGDRYLGNAVMVNSGSSADLVLVLSQLTRSGGPLEPGDEVCVPAVTWPTHLWSVMMAGLTPVLVDVNPETLNMCSEDLERKVTSRTGAIFPVHLMGNPAPMDTIAAIAASVDAIVLEDCCEALGATWNGASVGTIGSGGSFSFFFSHHITTMEGGMVLTRDFDTAERLRLLRAHGWSRNLKNPELQSLSSTEDASNLDPRYTFVDWGLNVRPTELQAGFGIEQLKRLSEFERLRKSNFEGFVERLQGAGLADWYLLPKVDPRAEPSWFALPLMLSQSLPYTRDDLTAYLDFQGIETRPIVAGNLARHPVREKFPDVFAGVFQGADRVHNKGFYVGLYPEPMDDQLDKLVYHMLTFHEMMH